MLPSCLCALHESFSFDNYAAIGDNKQFLIPRYFLLFSPISSFTIYASVLFCLQNFYNFCDMLVPSSFSCFSTHSLSFLTTLTAAFSLPILAERTITCSVSRPTRFVFSRPSICTPESQPTKAALDTITCSEGSYGFFYLAPSAFVAASLSSQLFLVPSLSFAQTTSV